MSVHREPCVGKTECREPGGEQIEFGYAGDRPEPHTKQTLFAIRRHDHEGSTQSGRMETVDRPPCIIRIRKSASLHI